MNIYKKGSGALQKIPVQPHHPVKLVLFHSITTSNLKKNYYWILSAVSPNKALEWSRGFLEKSSSSKGVNLFSTSLDSWCNSSIIIDSANLQDCSSLNARVHLPSTKAFALPFPKPSYFDGSKEGRVDGRMRKCNHFRCLSSILGW